MSGDFSEYVERIERIEESEEEEIRKVLEDKRMGSLKPDLEKLVEANHELIDLLERLNAGERPINFLDPLKELRKRQEKLMNLLESEIKLMFRNREVSKENEALRKIDEMESAMEEIEDLIIEKVKEKQPCAFFRKEDLDRFIEKVKQAVLPEEKNDMRGVRRSRETGGVFRIREDDGDYYFDTYIHLGEQGTGTPHGFSMPREAEKVMEKVGRERGAENNFVVAHSHPPGVAEGTVFDHSQSDLDYLREEEFLDLEGLTSKIGVLGVRTDEGTDTGVWVAVEMFLDERYFIPVRVEGLSSGELKEEYPLIHRYNQLLSRARVEDRKWFEYIE